METNKELMRAEFEAAYGPKEGFAWLNPDNTYKSQAIQDGWEIWQKAWQARAALSQRSEATEAQRKAELWDFFNARLLSRSGIVLNDKKDCQAAVDQWAEAHETHCTYKEKLRHAEAIALRGVTIHSATIPTPAPSEAAGEQVLAKLRDEFKRMQDNLETFGQYGQETARVAIDGCIDALDEIAEEHAQPTPAQGDARCRCYLNCSPRTGETHKQMERDCSDCTPKE